MARAPAGDDDIRGIEDIPLEELAIALRQSSGDEVETVRYFGVRRLTAHARERLRRAAGAVG